MLKHLFYFWLGLAVLCINKIRYAVSGYKEPRPFSPTEIEKAIAYDKQVVEGWLSALKTHAGQTIENKTVLELGPGADLGPALLLLDHGASTYITIDANRLIDQTPDLFYDELLKHANHPTELKAELKKTQFSQDDKIKYVVDPTFDLTSSLKKESIDVVVSQAAFEHFSNMEKTVKQLSEVVKPGGVFVAEIDLMTHTGAIRSRDPLNIYRFPNWLYKALAYSGIPNRLRPNTYKQLFEQNGWSQISIIPLQQLSDEQTKQILPFLASGFKQKDAQMNILSMLFVATKNR